VGFVADSSNINSGGKSIQPGQPKHKTHKKHWVHLRRKWQDKKKVVNGIQQEFNNSTRNSYDALKFLGRSLCFLDAWWVFL
jgi:hypothetical protein